MFIEDNGTRYEIIRGSDAVRDGMYLSVALKVNYCSRSHQTYLSNNIWLII